MTNRVAIKNKAKQYAKYVWIAVIAMQTMDYVLNPTFEQFWSSIVIGIFGGGLFWIITYFLVKTFTKRENNQ